MLEKLKPCPFCGENPEILSNLHYVWVECMNCHARHDPALTKEVAVTQWNRREGVKGDGTAS